MGYGDFKLFAALGAWLGWSSCPWSSCSSAATGAVLGILMIVLRGRDRRAHALRSLSRGRRLARDAVRRRDGRRLSADLGTQALSLAWRRRLRSGSPAASPAAKARLRSDSRNSASRSSMRTRRRARVVAPGTPGLAADRRADSAHDVLARDGELDRRALRELIFAIPGARRDLEEILHPLIRARNGAARARRP